MQKITKDMIIGDILRMDPEMAGVLVAGGMHCIGCPSAQMETIEEAALVHGIEPDLLVARVNAFVESKQTAKVDCEYPLKNKKRFHQDFPGGDAFSTLYFRLQRIGSETLTIDFISIRSMQASAEPHPQRYIPDALQRTLRCPVCISGWKHTQKGYCRLY